MSRWHINFKNVKNFKKAELANEFIQEIHVLKNDNARLNKVVLELDKAKKNDNARLNKENVRINKVVMELVKEKNQKFSKLF